MDTPFYGDPGMVRRARVPVAIGLLLALIGTVLGAAVLLSSLETDTRDVAARHGTVVQRSIL